MKSVIVTVVISVLVLSSFLPAYAQTEFELLGSRTYVDSADNYHIVGEIKNNTIRTWRFVEVTVPLIDENERLLAAPSTFLLVEYLRPGESGAFHIILPNSPELEAAVSYAIFVDYLVTNVPEEGLEVIPGEIVVGPGGGGIRITGEVLNVGNVTATQVQVSAALYDANNNLIDTTVGFSDDVPAGGRMPFTMVSGARGAGDVEHISFNVQSREYVMIPEFPVPVLGLVAGLTAAIVLARRYYHGSSLSPS